MSRCLLFAVGALEAVVGVEGGEDPRGMTESFGSPLGCRRAVYPPRRLQPTSLFLPGRRRWLKITPWPRALQRAAWAAKGKDNVLAALIRVCGCHILITSLKKIEKGRKKRKRKEQSKEKGYITRSCKGCTVSSFGAGQVGVLLWGNFLQSVSSWNAAGHGGEVGSGISWSGLGAQMSTLQANAYTGSPATCLELHREAATH